MSKNAADKKQVEEAGREEKFSRKQELADLRNILATEGGRRFVWRYLGKCGVFKSSFTGNSQTFFLEGSRNIGLQIMEDVMAADPDSYIKMAKENNQP
jgi:hypothetical protein